MRVVITGGAGFLGRRLAEALLRRGWLHTANGEQAIERITLVDVVRSAELDDPRLEQITGDVADAAVVASAIDSDTPSVFHLAAVVSSMAEADFDLGMRVNLDASRTLLDVCRASAHCPRVVFTSSVAVFGGELPAIVTDSTAPFPQSSYGAQKAAIELLINDYTRRGYVDGRVLRLPTISVRPGRPNAAASSFASGIIREPLNGEEAVCPVDRATRVWLLSPRTAVECLIHGHEVSASALGTSRIVNVPGISVSVAEMVTSLERIAGPDAVKRIRWQRDPRVERIVASWPGGWDTARARSLGFPGDENFDVVVQRYVDEAGIDLAESHRRS
jgi:nucleoside-diphosphate-sugar epimerase